MNKRICEILDEFTNAPTKKDKIEVLSRNWENTGLRQTLRLTYDPNIKWLVEGKYPENYRVPDTKPGISYSNLYLELRRLWMFDAHNEKAVQISEKRRNELLLQLLESLEPRESDVVIGIFRKDLKVKGLNHKFLSDNIPNFFQQENF